MSDFKFNPIATGKADRKTFEVFRGRRFYGHLHVMESGLKIYMALRHKSEFYRAGNGWAMDEDLLRALRMRGVTIIGVDVVGDEAGEGEQHITQASNYRAEHGKDFGGECDNSPNREVKQRYVRIEFFKCKPGVSIASKRFSDHAKKWKVKKAEKWERDLYSAVMAEEKAIKALTAA